MSLLTLVRTPDWLTNDKILAIVTNLLSTVSNDGGGRTNPNLQDNRGEAVIHHLMYRISPDTMDITVTIVTKLIELDANLNLQDRHGKTALHYLMGRLNPIEDLGYDASNDACTGKDVQTMATMLINLGADPNIQDKDGETSLFVLTKATELHPGNREDALTVITRLVELGADINVQNKYGRTALLSALHNILHWENNSRKETFLAVASKFLDVGADPDIQDAAGETALHVLVQRLDCNDQIITNLLGLSANLNIQDNYGRTALHQVLKRQYVQSEYVFGLCSRLLEFGADPNITDESGLTGLHIMALHGTAQRYKSRYVAILLQHGANPTTIEDKKGNLPLNYLGDPTTFDATTVFLLLQQMGIGWHH